MHRSTWNVLDQSFFLCTSSCRCIYTIPTFAALAIERQDTVAMMKLVKIPWETRRGVRSISYRDGFAAQYKLTQTNRVMRHAADPRSVYDRKTQLLESN
jgi:hypothetical protein